MRLSVSIENEGGRTPGDLSPYRHTSSQQGSSADTPRAPVLGEEEWRREKPHEELVAAFRHAILHERQALGELAKYHSPVKILDAAFSKQVQYIFSDNKEDKQRGEFFAQILHAWEVVAYEHYGKGSVIDLHLNWFTTSVVVGQDCWVLV